MILIQLMSNISSDNVTTLDASAPLTFEFLDFRLGVLMISLPTFNVYPKLGFYEENARLTWGGLPSSHRSPLTKPVGPGNYVNLIVAPENVFDSNGLGRY